MDRNAQRQMMNSKAITLLIVTITVVGISVLLVGPSVMLNRSRASLESKVYVGMTRSEVISRLGEPFHIARSDDEMRTVNFHPVPTEPVEKEVLHYSKYVWRMYVYIDRFGRVSAVEMART